jgi:hypothetical protein
MLRQACPEPVEGLSTNGKSSILAESNPFALSLSKGGYTFLLPISKRRPIVLCCSSQKTVSAVTGRS